MNWCQLLIASNVTWRDSICCFSILRSSICLTVVTFFAFFFYYSSVSTAGKSLIFCFSLINHLYHYYDSSLTQNAQLEVCGTPAVINAVHFRMRVYSGVKPNKLKATNRDVLELNIFPAQVWNNDVSLEPQRGEFTEDWVFVDSKNKTNPHPWACGSHARSPRSGIKGTMTF